MAASAPPTVGKSVPQRDRFETSRSTLLVDKLMNMFIKTGGLVIIAAVFLIFVFIIWQVIPLFGYAKVTEQSAVLIPRGDDVAALGIDEWGELPVILHHDGSASFIPADGGPVQESPSALPAGVTVTSARFDIRGHRFLTGDSTGGMWLMPVTYSASFDKGGQRTIAGSIGAEAVSIGQAGRPAISVSYGGSGESVIAAAIHDDGDKRTVKAVTFTRKIGLMGSGKLVASEPIDLTDKIGENAQKVIVDGRGESVIVCTAKGRVHYFFWTGSGFDHRQTFVPFESAADPSIATIDYILGEVSLAITGKSGANDVWSLYVKPGTDTRQFGRIHQLEPLPSSPTCFSANVRNKAFVIGAPKDLSLRFSTTATVRWQDTINYDPMQIAITGKYDKIFVVGSDQKLHHYKVVDPHPETSWKGLFGRVWYEGYSEPRYIWQSTGGTDDFEPKLSMINLIAGTLKGTFYAMLFAIPIALLGALYTSEFMHPRFKVFLKPTVEVMASLPSVVLGYLAAQWLAPLIEFRVPALLAMVIFIPLSAMLFGYVWTGMPPSVRSKVKPGYEFIVFLPILLLVGFLCWEGSGVIERVLFAVNTPAGTVGDFKQWWKAFSDVYPDQRNSLVVGIMMGFAVIPLIFTISEDALSNVPKALRSGSLALGASRWQTAYRVVLPTASAGIFSALMIGLGRAIGETMIVVMATGNTPIIDFNIFNGMRTLAANIAVELPEAPEFGTLYRTLFLGALLLFLMTFVVNTAAEIIRQRLREKYKTV